MALRDTSGLSAQALADLERALSPLRTLEAVVRWGFAQAPPALVEDVVVQDELTHDVVLRWTPGRWIVFGTT